MNYCKSFIISVSVFFLILNLSAQSTPLSKEYTNAADCPRLSFPMDIPLTNLVVSDVHTLTFGHSENQDPNFPFFKKADVEYWDLKDGVLYFVPTKELITFNNPGYNCNQAVINYSDFHIKNVTQNNKSLFPITLVDGDTPTTLVETVLLGDVCLDVSNASAPGGTEAYGQFFNGESTVGIETGIILANGSIFNASGPNTSPSSSSSVGDAGSDPDLAAIATGSINDVALLEFDFVPDQDSISFDYVFASEEYCSWVGSPFNDVFGFFLSGPGINGPFANGAENIALIPGTDIPVSINNVNYTTNGEYYNTNAVNDSGGGCSTEELDEPEIYQKDLEYDGFTTVLTAKSAVIPCETYHIKMAIADVGDNAFDSAVFLAKNSFISGDVGVEVTTEIGYTEVGGEEAIEGCSGAYIALWKNLFLSEVVIYFNIENTSTATEGLDYAEIPDSFIMNIGLNRDTLWLDIFEDQIAEGIETIDISLGGLCECADPSITINIGDAEPLAMTPLEDQGFCDAQLTTFSANVSGGNEPYSYNWSNGSTSNSAAIFVDAPGFHFVTVTDNCAQEIYDTVFVEIYPNYDFAETVEICEGDFYFVGGANQSTAGTYVDNFPTIFDCDSVRNTQLIIKPKSYYDTLIYSCANDPVNIGGQTINFPGVTDVTLSGMSLNGCDSIITVEVQWLSPISSIADPDTLNCSTDSIQLLTIVPNMGQGFEYLWEGPNEWTSTEIHPWVTEPGPYTLTVTQTVNGVFCESFFSFTNEVPIDTLAPDLAELPDITISCGLLEVSIDPDVVNADDIDLLDFDWTGPNGFESADEIISVSDSGMYFLIVTNLRSDCSDELAVHVSIDNVEPEITSDGGALGCNADSIQIFSNVNLINGDFSWSGPNTYSSSEQNPFVYESGLYFVEYQLTSSCIAYDTVLVDVDNTTPELSALGDTIVCSQGDGTLIATSGTADVEYLWTGPNGFESSSPTINVLDEGDYTIIVTGTNGCESQEIVSLVLVDIIPELEVFDDKIECGELGINLSVDVNDPNLVFLWTGPNGYTSDIESPLINDPGEYILEVTNMQGCTNSATLEIEADTLIPEISVDPATINCLSPTPTLDVYNVTENLDFNWSGPNAFEEDSEDVMVTEPGMYTLVIRSNDNGCENEYSINVDIDTIAPAYTSFGDTLDCNAGTGFLTSDVSGSEFDIRWYDEDNNLVGLNAIESVGSEGTYTIEVTNENNGCITSQSVEMFKNEDVPDLSAQGDTINCLSNSFEISSWSTTSGVVYNWEGPNSFESSTNNTTVTEPGSYTVTVTADNGCIAIETVEVVADDIAPTLFSQNDQIDCITPSLLLDVDASGNENSYDWTGPNGFMSTEVNPLIDEPGLYTVLVTSNNGCSATTSISITDDFLVPSIDLGSSNDLDCTFEDSQITLITNAPDGSLFSWIGPNSFTSDQEDITITEPGNYALTVTGINGCTNEESIMIDQDISLVALEVANDLINCYNPEVALDINYSSSDILSVNWTGPGSFSSVQLQPTVDQGGTYSVEVIGNNGCISTASIEITDLISYPESTLTGEDLSCSNENADLTATMNGTGWSYNWEDANNNNVSSTSMASATMTGYYFLTVTNPENGCTYFDSILVNQQPDLLGFDFVVSNPNCFVNYGGINISDVEGGVGPFSYSIDGGVNYTELSDFDQLDGGSYEIIVQDINGCVLESSTEIITLEEFDIEAQDEYVVVLGSETQFNVETSIPAEQIDTIIWSPSDNLSCTNCLDPLVSAIGDQEYTVTLIDQNGCELVATVRLKVVDNPIYVPNIFTPNDDGVNDYFAIFGDFKTIEVVNTFQIYDRWGNNVFLAEDIDPKNEEIKWDGTFKGRNVKGDVFAYYITYSTIDGKEKSLIGDVSVLR